MASRILLVTILYISQSVSQELLSCTNSFNKDKNNKCAITSGESTSKKHSDINKESKCETLCKDDPTCVGFQYRSNRDECYTYFGVLLKGEEDDDYDCFFRECPDNVNGCPVVESGRMACTGTMIEERSMTCTSKDDHCRARCARTSGCTGYEYRGWTSSCTCRLFSGPVGLSSSTWRVCGRVNCPTTTTTGTSVTDTTGTATTISASTITDTTKSATSLSLTDTTKTSTQVNTPKATLKQTTVSNAEVTSTEKQTTAAPVITSEAQPVSTTPRAVTDNTDPSSNPSTTRRVVVKKGTRSLASTIMSQSSTTPRVNTQTTLETTLEASSDVTQSTSSTDKMTTAAGSTSTQTIGTISLVDDTTSTASILDSSSSKSSGSSMVLIAVVVCVLLLCAVSGALLFIYKRRNNEPQTKVYASATFTMNPTYKGATLRNNPTLEEEQYVAPSVIDEVDQELYYDDAPDVIDTLQTFDANESNEMSGFAKAMATATAPKGKNAPSMEDKQKLLKMATLTKESSTESIKPKKKKSKKSKKETPASIVYDLSDNNEDVKAKENDVKAKETFEGFSEDVYDTGMADELYDNRTTNFDDIDL
eukprot:m.70814 g.70814  ORF g.70814 m.70814 type:complete len:592 (-) comp12168_c0_seq1:117-1892(-)